MNDIQSPRHNAVRGFLRVMGPIVALVGLVFLAVGLISFFSAFGTFQLPRLFWCVFVGMPLLGLGSAMCKFGYIGAVARYLAGESAPVAKDTINYMADGTKEAIKTVAKAVVEGAQEAKQNNSGDNQH